MKSDWAIQLKGVYMVKFIGSLEDYEKYIGPRIRNIVNIVTKSERQKRQGICDFCGKKAELQSAHKHGRDRKTLIREALKKYNNGSCFNVDVEKCENEIIKLHTPINHIFYFLCMKCHREYDSENKIKAIKDVNKTRTNKKIQKPSENDNKLSKEDAIRIINKKLSLSINGSNTTFSNINNTVQVWWFEPTNDRFNNDFHLILNDHHKKKLYYFFIKNNSITEPENTFHQKTVNKSQIIINVEDDNFQDVKRGFKFKKYLKDVIDY